MARYAACPRVKIPVNPVRIDTPMAAIPLIMRRIRIPSV
jgi:hypothetical protein